MWCMARQITAWPTRTQTADPSHRLCTRGLDGRDYLRACRNSAIGNYIVATRANYPTAGDCCGQGLPEEHRHYVNAVPKYLHTRKLPSGR